MIRKLIISLVHAVLLILFHIVYFNSNISTPLDHEILYMISKTEKHFFKEGQYKDSNFIFINTAYDNSLINYETEDGDSANTVIANRSLLGAFFKHLADNGNNHKFVFCDILFDLPSSDDKFLNAQLNRVTKILLPRHYDIDTKEFKKPIFNKASALADFITYEGTVSKIMLFSRTNQIKTLPLVMYEECNKVSSKVNYAGLWFNNKYSPYAIYPRFFFNRETMKHYEIRLDKIVTLLNTNSKLFYNTVLKDKIIVIGNFSTDLHITALGPMPGSLILFNTYLTLQSNYHLHSWYWFLFLLISFCGLSYYELFYRTEKRINNKWYAIARLLGLSGICIAISLISTFLFDIHTTIVPVILYYHILLLLKKIYNTTFKV